MKTIERAYNDVRNELWELGILADGLYLDQIRLAVSPLPRCLCGGAVGFIFDQGVSFLHRLAGFREGTIYIPRYVGRHPKVIRDIIRHEFAHGWAWLDGKFIRGRWFKEAFGKPYFSEHKHVEHPADFRRSEEYNTHATDYALTRPREDFAETFALFVKQRGNLVKFRNRPGLYAKLRAVETAVTSKAKTLRTTFLRKTPAGCRR